MSYNSKYNGQQVEALLDQISNGEAPDLSDYATKTELEGKQDKNLYFTNKVASSWVDDSTYDGYAYSCDVSCSDVTADYFAEVIFSPSDATSGNYAPVCETLANVVRIYSKTNDSITIPTIIINK